MATSLQIDNTGARLKNIELQPATILGDYSIDRFGKICPNSKQNLKFLRDDFRTKSSVRYDINRNVGDIPRELYSFDAQKGRLLYMQDWILKNKHLLPKKAGPSTNRIFPDFVFRRGCIARILNVPYSNESLEFNIVKFRETIYVIRKISEDESLAHGMANLRVDGPMYGPKFAMHMTGETGITNENEDYYCIIDTKLDKHRLMINGEVDGFDRKKYTGKFPQSTDVCIELKTNRLLHLPNARNCFERNNKQKFWWVQSSVFGVKEIVCGFRDGRGIVWRTEVIPVKDLPNYAGSRNLFDTGKMLNFASRFLDWLQEVIKEEKKVYHVRRDGSSRAFTCELTSQPCFLTQNYMANLFPKQLSHI